MSSQPSSDRTGNLEKSVLSGNGHSLDPVDFAPAVDAVLSDVVHNDLHAVSRTETTVPTGFHDALCRSEMRYRSLVAAVSQVVWITDPAGQIVEPCPLWEAFTGQSFAAYRGHGWRAAIHEVDLAAAQQAWQEAAATGTPYETPYRLRHRDGAFRHVVARGVPVKDADGTVVEWVGLCHDVTNQIVTAEALHRSEERYEMAAAAGKVGVWELNLDTGDLFLAPNLKALLGYRDDELPNHLDAWCDLVHPDDKSPTIAATQAYLEGRVPVYEAEVRRRHKNGSYRWFLAQGRALRDENGRAYRMIGSDIDITERKQAQEVLRESEERLRLGLEAGNTGTWDWDMVNNIITWSKNIYHFHGLQEGEFDGTLNSFSRLIHPADVEHVTQRIQDAITNGSPYLTEFRAVQPGGAVRWIATRGQVYYDHSGRPLRMLGAASDITERKQAEIERDQLLQSERAARAEVERASRMKDEFLAIISHELRTPLNAILGWASLLCGRQLDEGTQITAMESIQRNALMQKQIIEDLLDMNRIILGKLHMEWQEVDLGSVIQNAVTSLHPSAAAKNISIHSEVEPERFKVSGDPNRLQQVFWNLIANAVKFTPPQGTIRVRAEQDEAVIKVQVIDNGIGMDPQFLPHVFEPFLQADGSSTRQHGGLGLGLSIVKQLTELHYGTVTVHSDGPGCGVTFTIILPALSPVVR